MMASNRSIAELQTMSEEDKLVRINERLEDFHAANNDWQRVMADKWNLAKLAQTGGY